MEANSISPELQEEIQDKVRSYRTGLSGLRYAGELAMAYADGIAEYASKLHLLQQEYDKLKVQHGISEKIATTCHDRLIDLDIEYKALKAKADKMAMEHADLNLALAAMLNGYANLPIYQQDSFVVIRELIDKYTRMVLEYNSNTNQNENNG